MSCIFCRIIAKEIPAKILVETQYTLAFQDIGPLSAHHTVIIPKEHGRYLHDLQNDDGLKDLSIVMRQVARGYVKLAKQQGLQKDGEEIGYNILQNNGGIAHQEVPHVHFHMIPKPLTSSGLVIKDWNTLKFDADAMSQYYQQLKGAIDQQY
ncbi:hypothetical protein MP228_007479 [Amoeboaphelidium protococcarum]|nr:hypothetical protein MP228_007479 [Amoeboaphelidium protococcarum]